jgi:hypothetical protein
MLTSEGWDFTTFTRQKKTLDCSAKSTIAGFCPVLWCGTITTEGCSVPSMIHSIHQSCFKVPGIHVHPVVDQRISTVAINPIPIKTSEPFTFQVEIQLETGTTIHHAMHEIAF